MLCFHALGMHGKQFEILEKELGNDYTFYGFDLFFHKKTILKNQHIENIKKGISQVELASLITDFCSAHHIEKFSTISHSMGTFYASSLINQLGNRIENSFFIAPIFLTKPILLRILCKNILGNYLFKNLCLSQNGLFYLLKALLKSKILDQNSYEVLYREIETPELRFNLYACLTYLRPLEINVKNLGNKIVQHQSNTYFIFGRSDKSVSLKSAKKQLLHLNNRHVRFNILNENHHLINERLTKKKLFCIHDH